MLTLEGFTSPAILRSVSPRCTCPYVSVVGSETVPEGISACADGVPTGATVAVAAEGDVEGGAAGVAAGGVSAGRGAAAAPTEGATLCAYPGGSSRIGYSRWILPAGHDTSMSTSMNGSLIGATLVTLR